MKTIPAIKQTQTEILAEGVILCIRLGDSDPVIQACRAAVRGGLRVLELTLTTPGALEAMTILGQEEGIIVGGGTVLTTDQVQEVAAARGRFILSPVFDPDVVDEAHRLGLLAIPGAATPAEILAAHRHGVLLVKVYPSGALGGPAYLRTLRGPFPELPLVPTSGPTAETLADYFAAGAVAVGVGLDVFPEGFTLASVETAARRVWEAVTAAREKR